ncbi:MAG: cupin domain-containing protein [Gammaproteobacteria bacterium]|nr:cupin domain-containing protein [Gammaproteobacteria bacterium]
MVRGAGVLIERIVSQGQYSADGFWYEQPHAEWVMVVQGEAVIEWEEGSITRLAAGDWVNIPAFRKHRVKWTDPEQETVWLAVHYPVVAE